MREMVKLLYSFGYALRGVGHGIATQRNLRIHITAVIVVITFNFMAQMSAEHWCIEILCCMIVISLELVNTSVESPLQQSFDSATSFDRTCQRCCGGRSIDVCYRSDCHSFYHFFLRRSILSNKCIQVVGNKANKMFDFC